MRWLKEFKQTLDGNLDITDAELFRAFPELRFNAKRLDAALLFWQYGIVAEEFTTNWQRFLKKITNAFRRSDIRTA